MAKKKKQSKKSNPQSSQPVAAGAPPREDTVDLPTIASTECSEISVTTLTPAPINAPDQDTCGEQRALNEPIVPIDEMDELFRQVQRYTHTHGVATMIIENPGWLACLAMRQGLCAVTIIPNWQGFTVEQSLNSLTGFYQYLRQSFRIGDIALQLRHHEDTDLIREIPKLGLEFTDYLTAYQLTQRDFTGCRAAAYRPGECDRISVQPVSTDHHVQAFGEVAEAAYPHLPDGFMRLFFPDLQALHSKRVQGFVGYQDDRPVRIEAAYLFDGLGCVAHGACSPELQGLHLGDPVNREAIKWLFENGAQYVFSQVVPRAQKVAERQGAQQCARYSIWRVPHKTSGQEVAVAEVG